MAVDASAESVWSELIFYEEAPGKEPWLLRQILPQPLRTEGDKMHAGSMICCIYVSGHLEKHITRVEPPHLLCFEVAKQELGIEDCVVALGGCYQIHSRGNRAQVTLTTTYSAHLGPRWIWRPLEALFIGRLHRHIMRGIRAAVYGRESAAMSREQNRSCHAEHTATGGLACTPSQSLPPRSY